MGVDLIVCITGHVQDHLLANSYVDLRYARSGLHISDDPPILHKWIEGARKRKLERTRRPIIAADVALFGDETAISRLDMGLPRAHELTLAQLWESNCRRGGATFTRIQHSPRRSRESPTASPAT